MDNNKIFEILKGLDQKEGINLLSKWLSEESISDIIQKKILDSYKNDSRNVDQLKLFVQTLCMNYPSITGSKSIAKSVVIRKCHVPQELQGEEIEKLWEALENSTMLDGRIEKRILNRSGYYWVFATKALAAYIASNLYAFKAVTPYASVEHVANYKSPSLQKSLKKSPYPRGAEVVDNILLLCKPKD